MKDVIAIVIDGHAHIYPDGIAAKAAKGIGDFYDIEMAGDGTAGGLLDAGTRGAADMFVIHSVATSPEQVVSINNFISGMADRHPDRFIGFATLHQDMAEPEKEIERALSLGLRGVKMHPDFQKFCIDDEKMDGIYSYLESRMPILFHTGDSRYDYSGPTRVIRLSERFPKLPMICAHFGGWSEWLKAEKMLGGRKIWVDSSSTLPLVDRETALRLFASFDEDRIIFGSDYPMWDPAEELERFRGLGLPGEMTDKILYKNICNLLKIPASGGG